MGKRSNQGSIIVNDILYRVKTIRQSKLRRLEVEKYRVIRLTEKGYWIEQFIDDPAFPQVSFAPIFVNASHRMRYFPSVESAALNFGIEQRRSVARMKRMVAIMESSITAAATLSINHTTQRIV